MFMDYDSARACCSNGGCSQNGLFERLSEQSGGICQTDEQKRQSWGLKNYPLAMVYSPIQDFDNLFDTEQALDRGTLFSELDLPFRGESVYKSGKGGCGCG